MLYCIFFFLMYPLLLVFPFVVLLNCLYLSPQVLPFAYVSSPSNWQGMWDTQFVWTY